MVIISSKGWEIKEASLEWANTLESSSMMVRWWTSQRTFPEQHGQGGAELLALLSLPTLYLHYSEISKVATHFLRARFVFQKSEL